MNSLFFSWLIVWTDGVNNCGWCLAGDRGCLLRNLHQIPSVSWLFHHSLLTLTHLLDCLSTRNAISIVLIGEWEMCGGWGGGRGRGVDLYFGVIILEFFLFFFLHFYFLSHSFLAPLFKSLEHDDCCVYFFVFLYLWSL